MTTPKYTYKGTDITNLISGSTNTSLTNYQGFPSYDSASTYSTERPLPLNFLQSGVDISTKMNAEFIDFTTGTDVEYTIPSDYTTLRAILEGGGGGGGGNGGCGYNINSGDGPIGRNSGSSGGAGGNGLFLYVSDVSGISSFQYSVGTGGAGGANGTNDGDSNNSGQGNDGQGIRGSIRRTQKPGTNGGNREIRSNKIFQRHRILRTNSDANFTTQLCRQTHLANMR